MIEREIESRIPMPWRAPSVVAIDSIAFVVKFKNHLLELYAVPAHRWQRIGEVHLNRNPVPLELVVYQGQNTRRGGLLQSFAGSLLRDHRERRMDRARAEPGERCEIATRSSPGSGRDHLLDKEDQLMGMSSRGSQTRHYFRFHEPHLHLAPVFGDTWFGEKAEAFARFFGTPTFLLTQTLVVTLWIIVNVIGVTRFDVYPFILLNLAFSLQAAYAAPLILLAQTRQADRDKAQADADAQHRETLAQASIERQEEAVKQAAQMRELLDQNTKLTQLTQQLSVAIKALTDEIHRKVVAQ